MTDDDQPTAVTDGGTDDDQPTAVTDGGTGGVPAELAAADIEAVFWDIGGVVLQLSSMRRAHRAFVERLVVDYETDLAPDDALAAWRETLGSYFRERDGTDYRPGREGYRRAVAAVLDEDVSETAWRDTFESIHDEYADPHPDAIEAIERLAAEPVHVGVLSDVDHDEGRRILRSFGVFESLDAYTSSEAVGRTKPDPAMFETALSKAGVDPDAALMVGDRYTNDMEGGTRAGLWTVGYGAEDGPAVDYHAEDLREILSVVGVDA